MPSFSKRIKSLEGVRGMAAIMVYFSHFAVMFYPAFYWSDKNISHCGGVDLFIGQTPFSFLLNGNSGVMFFLILTGIGTYMMRGGVKNLTLRYIKLLVIALFSSLPVYILFQLNLTYYQQIENILLTPWFGGWNPIEKSYLSLLMANPLSSLTTYNGVLWTMPYFFWSSIIAALLYVMSLNCRNQYILYILFTIVFINMGEVYYIPCILGVFIANRYAMAAEKRLSFPKGALLFLLGIYLCAYPTGGVPVLWIYSFLPYKFYAFYHMFGAFCLIYAALYWSPVKHCMECSLMQFLGKYSMPIYVVHYGILISFSAWLFRVLNNSLSYNVSVILVFLATSVAVMVIAYIISKIMGLVFRLLGIVYDRVLGQQNNHEIISKK